MRTKFEAFFALLAIPEHPIVNASNRNLERLGDIDLRFAFEDALNGESTTIFLGSGPSDATNKLGSGGVHDQRMRCPLAEPNGLKGLPGL